GRLSVIRNPATDSGPTVGKLFAATPRDLFSPQAGFAWNTFGDGKTVLRGGVGIFHDQLPFVLFGVDRFLPPFFGIDSFVFPSFLDPQNALLSNRYMLPRRRTIRSSPTRCNITSTSNGKSRRVLFSPRGILVRAATISLAK